MATVKTRPEIALSRVHHELIQGFIEKGACPTNAKLGLALGLGVDEIEKLLQELSEIHGLVLHPHVCEPWVVHPFSLTPTMHWIKGHQGDWVAPCIWCSLGETLL